ncbi:MAG: hypothetical protein Q8P25_04150, partial [Candidatus Curtissbacteria bacterium]|nr:hypothetical protein [Candidatus Curtissbacteria bacterium]
ISNALGKSIVSPAVITCALTVLINNVLGLALVNRDANLLGKYPLSQASVAYAKKHNIKQTKIQILSTWVLLGMITIFIGVMIWRSLMR